MVSRKTVSRLSRYRRLLRTLQTDGIESIYSHELARHAVVTAAQVRRDLMAIGYSGSPNKGYDVTACAESISHFLDGSVRQDVALVGVGNLGAALLGYRGFENYGLRITGAFDRDPAKVGKWIQGRKVQPLSRLPAFVKRDDIRLGVLTVTAEAAQEAADLMIQAGIRGIWNFTPVNLKLPEGVVSQKEDLAEGLALLSRRLLHLSRTSKAGTGS